MSKTAVTQWDVVSANNTDVGGISIQGTAPVSNFDNAMREMMGQIATFSTTLVTLTGSQTLTNKTLTSPAVNTPTITGGTASSFTMTGSAFNGTVGATTPSTIAGTTGSFSGTLSATGAVTLSSTLDVAGSINLQNGVIYRTNAALSFRPNGASDVTNQFTIDSSGNVTINGTLTVTG